MVKCLNLRYLKINDLEYTTPDIRKMLLTFVAQAVVLSRSLQALHLEHTASSAKEGQKLLQALADD